MTVLHQRGTSARCTAAHRHFSSCFSGHSAPAKPQSSRTESGTGGGGRASPTQGGGSPGGGAPSGGGVAGGGRGGGGGTQGVGGGEGFERVGGGGGAQGVGGGGGVATFTLTLKVSGSGSTDPSVGSHTYPAGSRVAVKAVPATGVTFTGWSGAASGTTTPLALAMDTDKELTATFATIQRPTTFSNPVLWEDLARHRRHPSRRRLLLHRLEHALLPGRPDPALLRSRQLGAHRPRGSDPGLRGGLRSQRRKGLHQGHLGVVPQLPQEQQDLLLGWLHRLLQDSPLHRHLGGGALAEARHAQHLLLRRRPPHRRRRHDVRRLREHEHPRRPALG